MSTTYACRGHGTDPATGERCKAIATLHTEARYYWSEGLRGRDGIPYGYPTLTFIGCRPCTDAWHQRQIDMGADRIVAQPITDYNKSATVVL